MLEFFDYLFARSLGAEAYDDDGRKAQNEARHEFVNLEDFGGEAGEVELPHEGGDTAHEHARDGCWEGGALPEEGEEHDRAEGGTEAAPGEAHEAHDHVEEALALLDTVGTRGALHGDNHGDKGYHHDHAAADPHNFLVGCIFAEQVLVEVVTEGGCGNQQLGVGGAHDSGKDSGHEDSGDGRVAHGLAKDHKDTFRVVHDNAVGFHIVAAKEGNHYNCTEADDDPGHGDAAGILDFFGVLDAHEAHQNVRHAEVAETPGEARNQRNQADGLAGGGVGEKAHQVGVLGVYGVHGLGKAARTGHNHQRNHDDGNKHHGCLDEVGPAHGKESAHEGIAHDYNGAEDEAGGVVHTEDGAEELGASDKARHRVEQEERENEN